MHTSIEHLLGNMIFLVGIRARSGRKLGWWKFLNLFLAIGVLPESKMEQVIMLRVLWRAGVAKGVGRDLWDHCDRGNLGPEERGDRVFGCLVFEPGRSIISIATLAVMYICFEILMILIFGSSSSWLHLAGFALACRLESFC